MPRWRKGEDVIEALLGKRHLQQVVADPNTVDALVIMSKQLGVF